MLFQYRDNDVEVRTPAVQVQLLGVWVALKLVRLPGHNVGAVVVEAGFHVELHHPLYPKELFVGHGRPRAVLGVVKVELSEEVTVELM